MTIVLTLLLVISLAAAAAFFTLWYLQKTSIERAVEEYENKRAELVSRETQIINNAKQQAARQINDAKAEARQIAGEAMDLRDQAAAFTETARAMKNVIDGYGDKYLKPAESLLDDLADQYGHREAGEQLKNARRRTRHLATGRLGADCDYSEAARREGAERFILDAFNGKVDSILSRVKHDNHGTLEQEIKDAFYLVNRDGQAFRNARITDDYLKARLEELRWAAVVQELRRQEREEQRLIREQAREEAKARREYEQAQKEAKREEEMLKTAMAKARAQIEASTAEERSRFEMELQSLTDRLREAEERNLRAVSMAQQTKRGHVYIISNVGSFGEGVYKIGLTRRLEPMDRVKELGDASVPFEFDVHAIILSDDAPALETQLHKHFLLKQVNKVNHRKEFFRASLAEIRQELETLGIDTKWTMTAEAREYRESLAIEQLIESDPTARDKWTTRQLTLDPVSWSDANGNGLTYEEGDSDAE